MVLRINSINKIENIKNDSQIYLDLNVIKKFKDIIQFLKQNDFKITLVKEKELDILSNKIIKKELTMLENLEVLYNQKIKFRGFKEEELLKLMDFQYLAFLGDKKKFELKENTELLQKQKKLIEENRYFDKFYEFKLLKKFILKFPNTYFMFPKEKNKKRFVFYFYIFNENRKKEFVNFLNEINFEKDLINFVKKQEIYKDIALYAIGFSYVNNKLIRKTFYPGFTLKKNSQKNADLIEKYFKIKIENNLILTNFGIDIYQKYREIKIYEKFYSFNKKVNTCELQKILENKQCDRIRKYRNYKLIDTKYEFYIETFENKEIEILKKNNLFDINAKIFSLYLENGEIKNSVIYYK